MSLDRIEYLSNDNHIQSWAGHKTAAATSPGQDIKLQPRPVLGRT